MCELMLTERHLYIMENGISEPMFTIFIERIRDMEAQLKGAPPAAVSYQEHAGMRYPVTAYRGQTENKTEVFL